jgi:chromate reductase
VFEHLAEIPPYSEDRDEDGKLKIIQALHGTIASADAILIATPECNASVPGQLKNALDWASSPFPDNALRHKPVTVVGASSGRFGAAQAQAVLCKVPSTIGANVGGTGLPIGHAHNAFTADGRLADLRLTAELNDIVHQLLNAARAGTVRQYA